METIQQRLENLDKILADYANHLGLAIKNPNTELAKTYLNSSKEELAKLDSDECYERAFILGQLGYFVQKDCNNHKVKMDWADSQIKKLVASQAQSINQYQSYEEKRYQVCTMDQAGAKLNEIKIEAQTRVNYLEFITASIRHMCDTLRDMGYHRRQYNGKTANQPA